MSFKNFVENKDQQIIIVSLEKYKESLNADLSALFIKPTNQIEKVKKNIVDFQDLSRSLSEVNYPNSEELKICIKTGNTKKFNRFQIDFHNWSESNQANREITDKIKSILFQYLSKLYNENLNVEDIDDIFKSYLSESQNILEKMCQNIILKTTSIPEWTNQKITLEAIYPQDGWIISEAKVTIGDMFHSSFFYEYNFPYFTIKNIQEGEMSSKEINNFQKLISELRKNTKNSNILTLYLSVPTSDRYIFEGIKRDLCLGIKSVLPNHVILSNNPLVDKNNDLWKVKIEELYLNECLNEGDFKQYNLVEEDVKIRWIERINNEE
jgi:hypothetical protein